MDNSRNWAASKYREGGAVTESDPQYGAISYHNEPKDPPRFGAGGVAKKAVQAVKKMSKAEGEAAGLYHPIGGGLKLPKPVSEYKFETTQDPRFSPAVQRYLSPEDFLGKTGIPLVGDRATAGKLLTSVEGRPLSEAVELEGGPEFMMNFPYLWASEKGAASKIAKQARKAAESGKEVLGVNVVGSPTNVDFNKMVSETLLDNLDPTQLRKKDIQAFNAEMRKTYPNFVGIEHPELKEHLLAPKMGNVRTKFVQTMNKDKYQSAGFPDVTSARIAVTEPKLLDVETGTSGFTVGKFDPERLLIEDPEIAHNTYSTKIGGEYVGGLEAPIDYRLMFPDFSEARRMLGGDPTKDLRSFTFQSPAIQEFNQEWLDKVMPTYEEILKSKRYAGGGLIKKVAKKVLESKGKYGAERVEKAADLVPNLEKQFNEKALLDAFTGDNAKGLMVLDPAHFEEYAKPLPPTIIKPGPYDSKIFLDEVPEGMSYSEYLDYLLGLANKGGFKEIPYLDIAEKAPNDFRISAHEGRHRSRALARRGDKKTLIQMMPGRGMREPFPRYTQQEYIEALNAHLGLDPEVSPEFFPDLKLPLPEVFAKGGEVHGYDKGGKAKLEKEFNTPVDMRGFRQDPIEQAVRSTPERRPPRIIPNVVAEALNRKRKLSPAEAKIAGSYANPENQWDVGTILQEIDPLYTLSRGAETLKNVDYGAIKDLATGRYQLAENPRESINKGLENLGEAAFGALDVAPAGAVLSKPTKQVAKGIYERLKELEGMPVGMSIKPVGGQWMTNRLDKELEGIAMPDTEAELNKAVNGWIRGPLRKYLMNRMGTDNDELLKLYDAGIYHKPPNQISGYPMTLDESELPAYMDKIRSQYPSGKTNAKTPEGFKWEMSSDLALRPRTVQDIKDSPLLREQAPWIDKLDPNEIVYGLGSRGFEGDTLRSLGFDHIVDVLKNDIREGKLRPEQLNKVSIEDAAKRTHQYNLDMAKKAEETIAQQDEFLPKHREYPEGYKWVELKHPEDAKKTEDVLRYEGEAMGHCVGAYCEDVMSGNTRIFSLRDEKGKPHVTIEVRPPSPYLKAREATKLREQGMSAEEADLATENLGHEIVQIKGKGNDKPADKYLPYVQDFVKNPIVGNEWAQVGDFHNTDLIDARKMREHGVLPDMDTEGTNQILQEIERIYPTAKTPTGGMAFESDYGRLIPNTDMLKYEVQDLPSPYLTKEDIIEHLRKKEARPVEQSYSKYYETPKEEGMAGGGIARKVAKVAGKAVKEAVEEKPLPRNVAFNTYEQVPYAYSEHLSGMPEKSYLEKLDFTNEANWEQDGDLLAKYLGMKAEPSQRGVGLYTPPVEGAATEMNPQISTRTKVSTDQQRRWRNEMTPESQGSMSAMGATRGYFDVQGASPWVKPSEGGKRKYNAFHIVIDGKPTQEEMLKLGEIQNRYGFEGTSDLGKSGVFIGFNFDYGPKELKQMRQAFEADVKDALGKRVKGVKMVKSEGDYPGYEDTWGIHDLPKDLAGPKRFEGSGAATRQFMQYLDAAKEQNPLLAEFYAQRPSTELQKLMESMNIRDIKAPEKYGVGAPRQDVLNAREIFAREGLEGLRKALEGGAYLPAVGYLGLDGLNENK